MTTACHPLHDQYQCLRISGADSAAFLQAQLSADLRGVPVAQAIWTAWCNAKGQVRALLHVWQQAPDDWRLLFAAHAQPQLLKLRMYVLRAAVTIEEAPCPLGWAGPTTAAPQAPLARISAARALLPHGTGQETGSMERWRLLGALEGEAQLSADMSEKYIPQSLGLGLDAGYSLRKGCYPGQEIISRVHYRGRPPLKLRTRIAPETLPGAFYSAELSSTLRLSQALL